MNMTDLEADLMIANARIAELQRERDAAVAALKEIGSCMHCAHQEVPTYCPADRACRDCGCDCPCRYCGGGTKWEWRGVKEGNNDKSGNT